MINKSKFMTFLSSAIVISLIVVSASIPAFASTSQKKVLVTYQSTKLSINGKQVSLKDAKGKTIELFNYSGSIYVPLQAVSQALGFKVSSNSKTNTVILTKSTVNGTQTAGNSSGSTPPTGTPPTGTPPTGTPPTGTPPTGTPPTGTPSSSVSKSNLTDKTSKNAKVSAVKKQITVTYSNTKISLNGKQVSLKDSNGKAVNLISFNGYVWITVGLIQNVSGEKAVYDASTNTVKIGMSNEPVQPGKTSGQSSSISGTAAYLQNGNTAVKTNQAITASKTNESAVKVINKGDLTLSDSKIKTTGDSSSMDDSSFYGLNAAVLAESCSKITISDTTIETTGKGANGVFATGSGSTIDLTNVKINCVATGAHGVDATIAGVLNLNNVDITTAGDGASAAIATDRGGGTINVTGGTVLTTGTKSPAIYSTGNITATNSVLKTTGSEAVTIEGKNSVTLNNCTVESSKNNGVFIYQSFSGDAEVGTGNFTMNGGSLSATEGPLFYSTNTNAVISLKGASLNVNSGILLKAGADSWGTKGANGSNITLNADTEKLVGDIILDSISTATVKLENDTSLKGTINKDDTAKTINVILDKTSTWNVTGTSYISSLTDDDTTLSNIVSNGNTIYYDTSNQANSWLNGKTIDLDNGGRLTPVSK